MATNSIPNNTYSTNRTTPDASPDSIPDLEAELLSFELIQLCATTQVGEGLLQRIRALAGQIASWTFTVSLARFHRVESLFLMNLGRHSPDALPDGLLAQFQLRKKSVALRSAFLVNELHELLELFEQNRIPALPLKGAVLGQMAYNDIGLRPFADLDVVIHREDFERSRSVLFENEYEPFDKHALTGGISESITLWIRQQYEFKRARGFFNLDLHTSIMPPLYSLPVPLKSFIDRSVSIQVGSRTLRTFGIEDMLLVLCFHGVKNQWRQLKHVCDIAEFVRNQTTLDWDTVLKSAQTYKCERILSLGLHLAVRLAGAPVPTNVVNTLQNSPAARVAERVVHRFPQRHSSGEASFAHRTRDNLAVLDSTINKMRYASVALVRRITALFEKNVTN